MNETLPNPHQQPPDKPPFNIYKDGVKELKSGVLALIKARAYYVLLAIVTMCCMLLLGLWTVKQQPSLTTNIVVIIIESMFLLIVMLAMRSYKKDINEKESEKSEKTESGNQARGP